jgi:uncharacterized protein YhfF
VDRAAVQEWWESFRQAGGVDADHDDVVAFGDSAAMAEELAGLVVHGPRRATAGLLLDDERDQEPIPQEGASAVVVDGRGVPGG